MSSSNANPLTASGINNLFSQAQLQQLQGQQQSFGPPPPLPPLHGGDSRRQLAPLSTPQREQGLRDSFPTLAPALRPQAGAAPPSAYAAGPAAPGPGFNMQQNPAFQFGPSQGQPAMPQPLYSQPWGGNPPGGAPLNDPLAGYGLPDPLASRQPAMPPPGPMPQSSVDLVTTDADVGASQQGLRPGYAPTGNPYAGYPPPYDPSQQLAPLPPPLQPPPQDPNAFNFPRGGSQPGAQPPPGAPGASQWGSGASMFFGAPPGDPGGPPMGSQYGSGMLSSQQLSSQALMHQQHAHQPYFSSAAGPRLSAIADAPPSPSGRGGPMASQMASQGLGGPGYTAQQAAANPAAFRYDDTTGMLVAPGATTLAGGVTTKIYVENPSTGTFRAVPEAAYRREVAERRQLAARQAAVLQEASLSQGAGYTMPLESLRAEWRVHMLGTGHLFQGLLGGTCLILLLVQFLAHPSDWVKDGSANGMLAFFAYNAVFINSCIFALNAFSLLHAVGSFPMPEVRTLSPDRELVREQRLYILAISLYCVTFLINMLETPFDSRLLYSYAKDSTFYLRMSPAFKRVLTLYTIGVVVKLAASVVAWAVLALSRFPTLLKAEKERLQAGKKKE